LGFFAKTDPFFSFFDVKKSRGDFGISLTCTVHFLTKCENYWRFFDPKKNTFFCVFLKYDSKSRINFLKNSSIFDQKRKIGQNSTKLDNGQNVNRRFWTSRFQKKSVFCTNFLYSDPKSRFCVQFFFFAKFADFGHFGSEYRKFVQKTDFFWKVTSQKRTFFERNSRKKLKNRPFLAKKQRFLTLEKAETEIAMLHSDYALISKKSWKKKDKFCFFSKNTVFCFQKKVRFLYKFPVRTRFFNKKNWNKKKVDFFSFFVFFSIFVFVQEICTGRA